jgi:bacteriorhodopsin
MSLANGRALVWIWIASWLSGALVATHYKWGFFAFGIYAYLLLAVSLLHWGGISAAADIRPMNLCLTYVINI